MVCSFLVIVENFQVLDVAIKPIKSVPDKSFTKPASMPTLRRVLTGRFSVSSSITVFLSKESTNKAFSAGTDRSKDFRSVAPL